MDEMMNFIVEDETSPIITVIGVGGAGSNAVSNMYTNSDIPNVEFMVCNTDLKALNNSPVATKVQLGVKFSDGDGAGNNAENGKAAALESLDDLMDKISDNTKMVFLTAGMGGGTGTGATPVLAKALKMRGILTVGIVTIPFHFEGNRRINQAAKGIIKLNKHIDSLIIVDNQKILKLFPDLIFSSAYAKADEVVSNAAKGVAELINLAGYINVDFEDVRTVLANSGVALMGIATASGDERAMNSIKQAIKSPLLENNNIKGAKNILLNIVSSQGDNEITMDEVSEITDYVIGQVGDDAQVLWGVGYDNSLQDGIATTIIATDFDSKNIEEILMLPNIDFKSLREQINNEGDLEENTVSVDKPQYRSEPVLNTNSRSKPKTVYESARSQQTEPVLEFANTVQESTKQKYTKTAIQESVFVEDDFPMEIDTFDNSYDETENDSFFEPEYKTPVHSVVKPVERQEYRNVEKSIDSLHQKRIKVEKSQNVEVQVGENISNVRNVEIFNAIMQPNMSEKMIREIESEPAYLRHKKIVE